MHLHEHATVHLLYKTCASKNKPQLLSVLYMTITLGNDDYNDNKRSALMITKEM